jgi:hypothetical protein
MSVTPRSDARRARSSSCAQSVWLPFDAHKVLPKPRPVQAGVHLDHVLEVEHPHGRIRQLRRARRYDKRPGARPLA